MADVTEVIHKITYEVNNEALDSATRAIQLQLQELERLSRLINVYSKQVQSASTASMNSLNDLSGKIARVHGQVITTVSKTEALISQLGKGILKGLDISTDVEGVVAKVFSPMRKELDKIGTDSSVSFKNIATSLTSFTSVVEIGINLLSALGKEMYAVDGAFTTLTENEITAYEVAAKLNENYASEKIHLELLREEVYRNETSMRRLAEIRDELVSSYPGLANNLAGEASLRLKLADSIGKVNEALVINARIKAAEQLLVENEKEYLNDDIGFVDGLLVAGLNSVIPGSGNSYVNNKKTEKYNNKKNSLQEIIQRSRAELEESGLYQVTSPAPTITTDTGGETNYTSRYLSAVNSVNKKSARSIATPESPDFSELTGGEATSAEAAASEIARIFTETLRAEIERNLNDAQGEISTAELERLLLQEESYKEGLISKEEYEQGKERISNDARVRQLDLEREAVEEMMRLYDFSSEEYGELHERDVKVRTEQAKLKPVKGEGDNDKKQRGLTEAQKENIKKGIDAYQQLAQAAADAYNQILQAQINALDAEISIREKRVEEAKKLAEKGNVEALRIEEERLQKSQQQKERYVRQQQAVNAALTVSNAIAAVAQAAVAGGGYGSIATIAALIAALAAGYAAVTSMSSDSSQAFADGVVGYKGKGGPRDDKNWVRISSGESIITAEGTQRNRALLEAINKGAALHMIDPTLPLLMPMLKLPAIITGSTYATAGDMNKLEQKLDEVVDAIADNKMKQNIFFNEQGVGIMTERAMKKDRRRWS